MTEPNSPEVPLGRLRASEKQVLLLRLDDLLRFLGAPGDWGYGTQLGAMTQRLIRLRRDIAAAEPREMSS